MIGGLAEPLGDAEEIDASLLKAMLQSSLNEMRDITTADIGDKTMMDALIPAVEAAEVGETVDEVLKKACEAAINGAKASEQYASKFGRARSYKGTDHRGARCRHSQYISAFVGLEQFGNR